MEPIITYRHAVRGALEEFIEKTKFNNLLRSDAMIEIAASVAQHYEEGVQLYPEVYICTDMTEFRKQAPGGELYVIGKTEDIREGARKAMKKCAPLTSRDWDIIIEVNERGCSFGIFKSSSVPTSLTLETTYFSGDVDVLPPAIRVSCKKPSVVAFRSDCGKSLTICFTHDEVVLEDLVPSSELLVDCILADVSDEKLCDATKTFLHKIFHYALKGIHGTLICTVNHGLAKSKDWPSLLSDGIRLLPCIDFLRTISDLRTSDGNLEAICSPQSYYELVKGMLAFDGITVFSNDGKLLAYNVFVPAPTPVIGRRDEIQGARKRAFSVLEAHIGDPFLAAFYQSQDGKTAFTKL